MEAFISPVRVLKKDNGENKKAVIKYIFMFLKASYKKDQGKYLRCRSHYIQKLFKETFTPSVPKINLMKSRSCASLES